mgnify:CR=1 FL=1
MVKNGVQSLFTGLWVNKKPLKLSDFVIVVSNSLQLIISYHLPIEKNGKELVFNGWSLKEFYINRQWSKSYLLKLIVSRNNMPYINIYDLLSKYKKTEWFNSGKSELELNSKMLRYAIDFLESIPEEICTHAGVDIYLTFTKVSTNQELYDYYIKFSDSFRVLTATEFMFLNKLFIQRWKAII